MGTKLRRLPYRLRYVYAERLASRWRRRLVLLTNMHADVQIDREVRLGPGFRLHIPEGGRFVVAQGCDFRRDFVCEISGNGSVEIGSGTIFTGSTLIQISTRLTIGARTVFGQATMIADGNHRWRDPEMHVLDQGYDFTPIDIGDFAVSLSKVTIVAPVGEHAVVGAHSLVTKPVPPYTLVGGSPARALEYFGPPDKRPAELESL